jgi:hypothetical protein
MKDKRDTVYYWLQKAADAKKWLDDYDRWGVPPTFHGYQEYQRAYDEAMEQVSWMKRLAPFEADTPHAAPDENGGAGSEKQVWQLRYYDDNPSRGGSMTPYETFVADSKEDAREQLKQYIQQKDPHSTETVEQYLSHYRDFVQIK